MITVNWRRGTLEFWLAILYITFQRNFKFVDEIDLRLFLFSCLRHNVLGPNKIPVALFKELFSIIIVILNYLNWKKKILVLVSGSLFYGSGSGKLCGFDQFGIRNADCISKTNSTCTIYIVGNCRVLKFTTFILYYIIFVLFSLI